VERSGGTLPQPLKAISLFNPKHGCYFQPCWPCVGSKVNSQSDSRRTETYNTNLVGTTKLRDGSAYLDPTIVNFKRWRTKRIGDKPPCALC
jgi:hypothetical protein